MIYLGLDPGKSHPGLGVIERTAAGWFYLDAPILKSLNDLYDALNVWRGRVQLACYERQDWAPGANVGHGFGSGEVQKSVGALEAWARAERIPLVGVMPVTWRKRVTGNGRCTKQDARRFLQRVLKGMPKVIGLNRSDALAIAFAVALEGPTRKDGTP